MSDEEHISDRYLDEYEAEEDAERPQRSLWGLLTIIVMVIVVIVAFMMLRDRGGRSADRSSGGGRSIEAVENQRPVRGMVCLWVSSGTDVESVLTAANVDGGTALDMGDGRWVVDVPEGTEKGAIKSIARQSGVHDAGLVYEPIR